MTANKTACIQHDAPTKNRFIGAMEAIRKLCESAAKYGIKLSTASNLWTKYKNTSTTKNIPRSGHPPKLSDQGQWLVVQNCHRLKDRHKPFQQVAQDTSMNISEHIVWDVAADAGYHWCVVRNVSFLTALQKRKRTAWANKYKGFQCSTMREYTVIWSDECYIHLNDKSGWVYVTHCANEEYDEDCVIPTFKQSSVCVMFWQCTMKSRKGPLVFLEYTRGQGVGMTGQRYISQVLKVHLNCYDWGPGLSGPSTYWLWLQYKVCCAL